ncbi:MAG: hypothetical protein KDA96_20495 [Planctomycetaceae bacterium]|nr:hypothetical protein [Planctomycetaceae bacterium]
MKTMTRLAAIAALVFLSSSVKADDYGWSGSSSRSHYGSGYDRWAGYYNSGYGSTMGSHYEGYNNDGYRHVPARINLTPATRRISNFPVYGSGYRSGYAPGYGTGYNSNAGYCPYDRIGYGSGYYGR